MNFQGEEVEMETRRPMRREPNDGELDGSGDDFEGSSKIIIFGRSLNNPLERRLN
jgi:hypothetical protein